jgi:hypothetical protein
MKNDPRFRQIASVPPCKPVFLFPTPAVRYAGALNLALFLLLFVPADIPRIPATEVRSFDLALLSRRQAQQLDVQRVRMRVDLESKPGDEGGAVVYDSVSLDAVNRTVWLVPGQQVQRLAEETRLHLQALPVAKSQ